jgi:hypothetical protein
MEDNVPCMNITFAQPKGSRKKGRPILKWLEWALKDLKTSEVTAWWEKNARLRDLCNEIIREAKQKMGCSTKE